ncbi:ATP synthase subunit b, sodium ion specific [subsurface metagenome]
MEDIGISVSGLVAQLINVSILLLILYFVLYKPILRMFNERSSRIKESMEQAEEIKHKMAETEEQVRQQLEAARREGQNILAQAGQMGEEVKEGARQEARQEAEAVIAKARLEIERERDEAFDELRRQFVDLAIVAAEKVIDESLDKEKHRRLIVEVLAEGTKGTG